MKLLICGSREFKDYDLLERKLDEYLSSADLNTIELVSGGAKGADMLAARYARARGIRFKEFPAHWDTYGKSAGFVRNSEMADYCQGPCNTCIAFWNGSSSGTQHMMKTALSKRMTVVKIKY